MPCYVQCCDGDTCGEVFEHFRPLADIDPNPPCQKCDGPTHRILLPAGSSVNSPAIVVFRASDGTFRFPGSTEGSAVAKYEKLGYERIEAKGWAEVRRLETRLNEREASEVRRRVERQCELHEEGVRRQRSEMFNGLANSFRIPIHDKRGNITGHKSVRLSPAGRAVAMAAMERNNGRPGPQVKESGGHFEAFSYDSSNREPSRDERGQRHRD